MLLHGRWFRWRLRCLWLQLRVTQGVAAEGQSRRREINVITRLSAGCRARVVARGVGAICGTGGGRCKQLVRALCGDRWVM